MITFIKSTTNYKDYPDSKDEIVFVGRSNVGKSSLINTLFNERIAYVGKTPGKTKMLNFFSYGNNKTIVDVPGYGFANRDKNELILFGKMMEEYFTKRKKISKCVLILDIRRTPNKDDLDMLDFLRNHGVNTYIVLNKKDKFSYSQGLKAKKDIAKVLEINENKILDVSCTNLSNIDKLKELLNID